MKKITLLLVLAVGFSSSLLAQSFNKQTGHNATVTSNHNYKIVNNQASNDFRAGAPRWYSYLDEAYTLNPDPNNVNFNYLFPDSNVLALFGTTVGSPFVHSLYNILDPTAHIYNVTGGDIMVGLNNSYSVDSMEFIFNYIRNNPDPNIIDTLSLEVFTNSGTAANISFYYFTGMLADFGSDTLTFADIDYNYQTNEPTATGAIKVLIPMDAAFAADTIDGFNHVKISTSSLGTIAAGRLVAATAALRTGYTYSLADSLNQNNYILFAAMEENGASTFPSYTPNEFSVSGIVPTEVRYNLDPNPGWNGLYIPNFAYTAPFSLEHHYFRYLVSCSTCNGVGVETPVVTEFSISAFPNPASDLSVVKIENENNLSETSIVVTNVLGATVKVIEMGVLRAGANNINFNTASLPNGVYNVAVHSGNFVKSTKLVVVH